MHDLYPLVILAIGTAVVLGMIVVLRVNAFLALITAAMVVSLLAPGELGEKFSRVAAAFGKTAGDIGIVIALASVIGKCMMDSGAADRIVQAFLSLLGEKRSGSALAASGFVLSVPVFFDTVFYLLVPLARSMYRRTGRQYVKCLMAIAAGGVATHTLVPPTPGPLFIADKLGVDLGTMILTGSLVGFVAASVGLLFSGWVDRRMPIEMRPMGAGMVEQPLPPDSSLPGLFLSLLPIILPVLLITVNTVVKTMAQQPEAGAALIRAAEWTALVGNPNLALLLSAAVAIFVFAHQRGATRQETAHAVEQGLLASGVIILITAAGGAFGAMLREAGVGDKIAEWLSGEGQTTGLAILWAAFFTSSLLKFSQGSSTVAMITASGMFGAIVAPDPATEAAPIALGFHPVYLALAIGSGSLVGSWMNDSGFWIFSKMGGLTEIETLKSWTPLLAVVGITGMLVTVLLAVALPMV